MKAADFRRIVLGLSGVVEGAHMGHADFRVGGRIFASLDGTETEGRVKLSPDDQARFVENDPGTFVPANGSWGLNGWTGVRLQEASEEEVGEALTIACQLMAAQASAKKKSNTNAASSARATQRRTSKAKAEKQKGRPAEGPEGTKAERPRDRKAGKQTDSPIDTYISATPREVQPILRKIRAIVREEAPGAEEKISYRMPAFFLGGALIYFAPFTHHIGIFPPVKGDARLEKALAKYRGDKGNLRFPLDEAVPYDIIRRVVQARVREQRARLAGKKRR